MEVFKGNRGWPSEHCQLLCRQWNTAVADALNCSCLSPSTTHTFVGVYVRACVGLHAGLV